MMKSILVASLGLFLAAPIYAAPPAKAKPAPKTVAVSPRQKVFDIVWRTVRDSHYDPKLNGVNWVAARAKYLPQALKAKDDAAFYAVLNALLGELKQSHLGAIPPAALKAAQTTGTNTAPATGRGSGETGITAQWIDGVPVVVRVQPNSAGADAGVKPGFVVTAINDKPLLPVIQTTLSATPNRRAGEERVTVWALLSALLSGIRETPYMLAVTDNSGAAQTLTITPRKPTGETITFGALPPITADIETRTLAGGVGYVRFSIFLIPVSEPVKDAIRGFAAAKASAIIIDLRGNRGGVGVMASGIAGTLLAKETSIGTMRTRASTLTFTAYPQDPVYTGRVVILTDEGSISTSEIMAAGLQEAGRATVIGRQTAGMVLPSQIVTLPDGGRLQFVFADFKTPKGTFLEGRGVTPDVEIPLTRETLAASTSGDPVLDAALTYLNQKETVKP